MDFTAIMVIMKLTHEIYWENDYEFNIIINLVEGDITIILYDTYIYLVESLELTKLKFKEKHCWDVYDKKFLEYPKTSNFRLEFGDEWRWYSFGEYLIFEDLCNDSHSNICNICNYKLSPVSFPYSDEFMDSLKKFHKFMIDLFDEIRNDYALDTIKKYVGNGKYTKTMKDFCFKPFYESKLCMNDEFRKIYETTSTQSGEVPENL